MTAPQDSSLSTLILGASGPVQAVMAVLTIVAFWTLVRIVQKYLVIRNANSQTKEFIDAYERSGKDIKKLYANVLPRVERRKSGALEKIFFEGMKESSAQANQSRTVNDPVASLDRMRRAMRIAYQKEVVKLEKHLDFLASVGSVSPYVGLFGTVWGIMNSFRGLSNLHQTTLAAVAPGISEALIATAIGLVAAIPAVAAYNRFSHDIDLLAIRFENFIEEISNLLAR